MKLTIGQMRALLVIVVSIPASVMLFNDFIYGQPSPNDQLVHGQVIGREMGLVGWLRIQRPLLTIQLENSDVIVKASLSMNGINDMPDNVTFYFSGDANREVYLQEEYNPIWGSVFFVTISVVLFLLFFVYKG